MALQGTSHEGESESHPGAPQKQCLESKESTLHKGCWEVGPERRVACGPLGACTPGQGGFDLLRCRRCWSHCALEKPLIPYRVQGSCVGLGTCASYSGHRQGFSLAPASCFRITFPHRACHDDIEHTSEAASTEERPGLCGLLRKTVPGLSLQLWFVQEEI